MARGASAARLKSNRSYTIEEAAQTVGVTQQTVRSWTKQDLLATTDQRPFLILGSVLGDFLKECQQKWKCPPVDRCVLLYALQGPTESSVRSGFLQCHL